MSYNISNETVLEGSSLQESNDIINIVKNQETDSEFVPEMAIQIPTPIPTIDQEQPKFIELGMQYKNTIIEFLNKNRFWIIVALIFLLLCIACYYVYKNNTSTIGSIGIESPTISTPREPLINLFNRPTSSPAATTSPTVNVQPL